MYIQRQPVSALQQQTIIRSSYTGLDQSEGQDLVLLQSILKITTYEVTHYVIFPIFSALRSQEL